MLSYVDLLSYENLTNFQSYTLLTNPNARDILDESYIFHYKIDVNIARLDLQCNAFARLVSSMQYDPRFSTQTWNNGASIRVSLRELYKYSFCKLLYLINQVKQGTEPFVPPQTKLFIGHKMLYLTFRMKFLNVEQIPSNSLVQKTISFPDLYFEQLRLEIPMLNSIAEQDGFIPEYELAFKNLKDKIPALEIVNVSDLSIVNGQSCPLGNMCFTFDDKVKFVKTKQPYMYRASMFWNTANFITLMTEQLYEENSIYSEIDITSLSSRTVTFEVYAICGLDPNADVGRYPKGNNPRSRPTPQNYYGSSNGDIDSGNTGNTGQNQVPNKPQNPDNSNKNNNLHSVLNNQASSIVNQLILNNKIDIANTLKHNTKFKYVGDGKIYVSSKDQSINNRIIVELTIEDKINEMIRRAKASSQDNFFVNTADALYKLVNRQFLSFSEFKMLQNIYNVTLVDVDIVNSPGATVNV